MSICQKINEIILKNTRGKDRPQKLFIPPEDYTELLDTLTQMQRERPNALIGPIQCTNAPGENVLFHGVAICPMIVEKA